MTTIKVIEEKDGSFELYVTGHSGYAKAGKDIVCAAVSILTFTLIESIEEKDLVSPPITVFERGKVFIRAKPKQSKKDKICAIFDVICNGFEILQKNFEKNVKFDRVWVRK